ncbi:AMM_1a_G0000030.mRNA.1.CDS.1 [Saccharomyces cerevisiae]|nr:AMM_1a_G0000030.mRNA.1.CDS.1 [Saccharomyces cerevisiae]CAI6465717.1 AMM_1a_G0000030.mRNA.1.CDS.1 [Saccharomyces cerevisiae]
MNDVKTFPPSNIETIKVKEDRDVSEFDPNTGVKRALENRHISLLALGGIIGPGCLIGAGNALQEGGPLALLLGFVIIGIIAFAVMESIGEMITLYPSGGGFTTLARRFHSDALSADRPAFGFHYWKNPGSLSHGFKGIALVFVFCSSFYSGTESVALTATESKNPTRSVPYAVRQTFWRILVVYIGIAIFYGSTVPFNDPNLSANTKVLKSPIAIAISRAGWAGGSHLVNAFIFFSCISAINGSIYIGSRTLTNLAHEGIAPKILAWTDKRGVPVPAITIFNALGLISMMNVSVGSSNAYSYIVNLSGVGVFYCMGCDKLYAFEIQKSMGNSRKTTGRVAL